MSKDRQKSTGPTTRKGYTPKAGPKSGAVKQAVPPRIENTKRKRRENREASLRRAPEITFRDRFYERLIACLDRKATTRNWSPSTRQNVTLYAHSLVYSADIIPQGLTGAVLQTVRWNFAMTCFALGAKHGQLPGQSTDWFPEKLEQAKAFRAGKRTQAHVAA